MDPEVVRIHDVVAASPSSTTSSVAFARVRGIESHPIQAAVLRLRLVRSGVREVHDARVTGVGGGVLDADEVERAEPSDFSFSCNPV